MLDGAMGTQLTARGLQPGQRPELAAVTMPQALTAIHRDYVEAGAEILCANTFGANPKKLVGTGYSAAQMIEASIACARRAAEGSGALVALDVGPIGELLAPAGTLSFADAYDQFSEMVRAGSKAGADLVFLETMTDLYELKAALLAAKENCALPVFASMSFEERGRTFTGCTVDSFAAVASGLGADAVGINCSLGPQEILPLAKRLCRCVPAGLPVFVKPNDGLPRPDGTYALTPEQFAGQMQQYATVGVSMVGGCCGTNPETIRLLSRDFSGCKPADKIPLRRSVLCTPVKCVEVDGITVVGERINPTGKKRLQAALRAGDMDYACAQAVTQAEAGAQVLDVNAGLPDINEADTLESLVQNIQSVTDLPLQLDSSNPEALARALRIYNGKPIVNSVNGEQKTLDAILPLCKKYGAAVVGLALDEHGIPQTAAERLAVARRIAQATDRVGIPREDVYIDCLSLTVSAQQEQAVQTVQALAMCKKELGVRTVLGVSNISFGLPCREYLNAAFLLMAMQAGLDLAIMNPNRPEMMGAVLAYRVLTGQDPQSAGYLAAYANAQTAVVVQKTGVASAVSAPAAPCGDALGEAVRRGLRAQAKTAAQEALKSRMPLEIVNETLIPALDTVGQAFEKGTMFLPQLLQSAAAAQAAFEPIKDAIAQSGGSGVGKGKIVIATVKGDIHDIGKNIVRVILENYGYEVIDLGRDVPPEQIVEAARKNEARLVGLSALMTTTVPNMQATIEALHTAGLPCKVMVGGAVLTPDYAKRIEADFYAADAKAAVDIAKSVFGR